MGDVVAGADGEQRPPRTTGGRRDEHQQGIPAPPGDPSPLVPLIGTMATVAGAVQNMVSLLWRCLGCSGCTHPIATSGSIVQKYDKIGQLRPCNRYIWSIWLQLLGLQSHGAMRQSPTVVQLLTLGGKDDRGPAVHSRPRHRGRFKALEWSSLGLTVWLGIPLIKQLPQRLRRLPRVRRRRHLVDRPSLVRHLLR